MPFTALVTGAGGFVGANLVSELVRAGHRTTGLVRDPARARQVEKLGGTLAVGDLFNPSSLDQALKGVDVVFHLAGALPHPRLTRGDFFHVNVEGTRVLLEACRRNGSVKHVVHAGTAFVVWKEGAAFADEETEPAPSTDYERSKLEGERIALAYSKEGGFPVTVLRPGFIYGPWGPGLLPLFQMIRKGRFVYFGSGGHLFEVIHAADVARAFRLAALNPAAYGETFLVTEPAPGTFREFIGTIAKTMSVPAPSRSLPLPLVRVLFGISRAARPILGREILPATTLKTMTCPRAFDGKKARERLGFAPTMNREEGLRLLTEWFQKEGLL